LRWIVPTIVLSLSVTLLVLGVPRFISSVLRAPAHATLVLAEAGQVPPVGQLARAARHLERARTWESSAKLSAEIGFLRLLQASQMDESDPDRPTVAKRASTDLSESLRLSPARPHPWIRLAYARAIEGAEPPEIVRLLDRSIQAGPYVGEIAIVRLKKLLADWKYLTPNLRLYTYRQIRWVWNSEQSYLLRAAKQTTRPDIMRFALRANPEAVKRLNRAVPEIAN